MSLPCSVYTPVLGSYGVTMLCLVLLYTILTILTIFTYPVTGFCPDGCVCSQYSTSCISTDLEVTNTITMIMLTVCVQVMPITLSPSTKDLVLNYNKFTTVDASISFYPVLKTLDLTSNKLTTLQDRVFMNQHILEDLNIMDNHISDVSKEVFRGLKSLVRLNLNKNKIKLLKNQTFYYLPKLEVMSLADNLISMIEEEAFMNLNNLKVLNLQENNLKIIPTTAMAALINLEELNMSGNRITAISSLALQSLPSLVTLALARNKIREIHHQAFQSLDKLEDLYLESNELCTVPTNGLSKVKNLKKIVLGNNPIKEIHENALKENINLIFLNISHCHQITEITAEAFKKNLNLKTVVISNNPKLEKIDSRVFGQGTQLRHLDLRRNGLSSLSENLTDWTTVKTLQLSENMWHCSCDLIWLQQTIVKLVNSSQASVRIVKCFSPRHLYDHDIVTATIDNCDDVSTSDKYVESEKSVIFNITIVSVSLVVSIASTMITISIFSYCSSRRPPAKDVSFTTHQPLLSYNRNQQ